MRKIGVFYKKLSGVILSAVMLLNLVNNCYGVTSAQLQNQKKNAESKLNTANKKAAELEGEKAEAEEEVEAVDNQLVELLATIDILEGEISAKKDQVERSGKDYEIAKGLEKEQYDAMKQRIRFMYEQGETQYLELILQSQSIADAINKADYAEKVYDYDRKLLNEFQQVRQQVADIHEKLVNEESELEAMQGEYKEQQVELEQVLSEKKAVVENFDEKLAMARQEAKRYEQQVRETNTQIAKIAAAEKAAREKAEREARLKAEAAAKAKAEAEAKAKAEAAKQSSETGEASQEGEYKKETAGEVSQEGEYKADTEKAGEVSQEGEYKDTTPAKPQTESKPVVSGSGTGSQVASFACQFIGNPYVAGGSSLTSGTDCSGFTMSVYKHFGINIPRTSYSQQSCGRGVSYAEAQPGDIMCYAGHVGIYIGNGMIVHASTPATGIKTTVATYRPILAVRRVLN